MSWLQKLLPPRIKATPGVAKKAIPEGLWVKCPACEAVLYRTDLDKNLNVCPKCSHHGRVSARERIEQLLDPDGRYEIGSEVLPIDTLKFKDTRKYPERLAAALEETGETDSLVVMQGSIKSAPLVVAVFEFDFMGGSMGSVVGERFVRGVRVSFENRIPFVCITSSGGARMQEGVNSLFQMAKTAAVREGLVGVELPGRLQVLPGRPVTVLDVAHNAQAAAALADSLASMGFHPQTYAVFGIMSDKDIDTVIATLRPRVDRWHVADLPPPRGATAVELRSRLERGGVAASAIRTFADPASAYRAAREAVTEADRIVVFGSFLTVAAALPPRDSSRGVTADGTSRGMNHR